MKFFRHPPNKAIQHQITATNRWAARNFSRMSTTRVILELNPSPSVAFEETVVIIFNLSCRLLHREFLFQSLSPFVTHMARIRVCHLRVSRIALTESFDISRCYQSPVTLSITSSGSPPTRLAITAFPAAIASRTDTPRPSNSEGRTRDIDLA